MLNFLFYVAFVSIQCIVLLEDVDVAFPRSNRTSQSSSVPNSPDFLAANSTSEVTFSGLLNILDGAVSRYKLLSLF